MNTGLQNNFIRSPVIVCAVRIMLLTLAYVIAGRLSLLLAIPPGFVSGLFLPMGISLGAVLIWGFPMAIGVFLGSVLLNMSISPAPAELLLAFGVASAIACGSTLASVVGAMLIRRFVGFPNNLTDERRIFAFFTLGGPIATSLSASVGVLVLYYNGLIPAKHIMYSWWTWWIGDAIGVLIATPLVCVLFAEPRHFWRGRQFTVGIPLVISSLIVVAVFIMASNNEQKKLDEKFQQQAHLVSDSVKTGLSQVAYTLATLRGLFIASDHVTRTEFSSYIEQVMFETQGVSGFAWNQRVTHAERADFEALMRKEGAENFTITEKNSAGDFMIAPVHAEYVSIAYVQSMEHSSMIIGFNAASDPARVDGLDRARDTGQFAMTKPLQLLQDTTKSSGVVVYYPVYKFQDLNNTVEARRESLLGYATGIIRINDLITSVLKPFSQGDYHLSIMDVTDVNKPQVFYRVGEWVVPAHARDLIVQEEILMGGRRLQISVSPTEKFLTDNVSLQSWFVLAGGLLFCSLLGGFLLLISGRTQHIRNLVEQRTKELAAILENAVESILVVDEFGIIQKANPAAAHLFKYPVAQLSELHIAELVPELRHRFTTEGDDLSSAPVRDTLGRCKDGSEVEIELSVSPVAIHERKFFTFIIHDATDKRKMDRLKSEFISTVSHELRTPLTSIKGALSILLSGSLSELPRNVNDLLVIANNNAERLSRLVNDILDIDKLEFGNLLLHMDRCAIYPLLQQAIEQNQGYATRYGVSLQLDNPTEAALHCTANIDTDRFLQIMANLLSNAIKFSNLDSVVRVKLDVADQQLMVSVIDEGQGIADEFRPRIFQKFAQADSSDKRRRDGTGLGLSITKVIVERMGGTVDYHSVVNKGTTFYFTLPLTK